MKMLDLTLMTEVIENITLPKVISVEIPKSRNWDIWIVVIIIIAIFGLFGYLAYRDSQKTKDLLYQY